MNVIMHNGNGLNSEEGEQKVFLEEGIDTKEIDDKSEVKKEQENTSDVVGKILVGSKTFYEMIDYDSNPVDVSYIVTLLAESHNKTRKEVVEMFEGLRKYPSGTVTFSNTWDAIGGYTVMTVTSKKGESIKEYVYSFNGNLFGKPAN